MCCVDGVEAMELVADVGPVAVTPDGVVGFVGHLFRWTRGMWVGNGRSVVLIERVVLKGVEVGSRDLTRKH